MSSTKKKQFLIGCATGAITATGLFLFRKYLSSANDQDKIIIVPAKPTDEESKEESKEEHKQPTLIHHRVYKRLQQTCKPQTTFYCQYAPNAHIPLVTAINILVEYLPNIAIETIFLYLPNEKDLNVSSCLRVSGWNAAHDILHDYPTIFVENVLPIKNQPSLILTIGLPGSGKTTWAKVRTANDNLVIAADDFFDKFHKGEFNVSLLSKAHEWCQKQISNALNAGHTTVANNTNTTLSEMHTYVTKVLFGELPHKIVFAVMPETNTKVLAKRGVHGVPGKKLKEMLKRMNYWLQRGPPSVKAVLRAGAFRRWQPKNTSKEVIYTGVFMDQKTQDTIRRYYISMSRQPLLCDLTDCHMTLKYLPLQNEVDRLPFGKRVYLKIIGYALHENVNCFLVDIMDEQIRKMCSNKYAHITVSFNKTFVRPNYSNELLMNGRVVPVIQNLDVLNSINYDALYRNVQNVKDVNGGGLIVQGTVGAFFKDPNGGVLFERARKGEENEEQKDGDKGWSQQKPKRKRRRGRNRNRNKNKNDGNNRNNAVKTEKNVSNKSNGVQNGVDTEK